MGKLTSLKPTLPKLNTTLAWLPNEQDNRSAARRTMAPWLSWYDTARWKRLRRITFLRDLYQCQMCNRIEGNTSKLVADHKVPHRGRPELFWDENNLWTLCNRCHSSTKQKMEHGGDLD